MVAGNLEGIQAADLQRLVTNGVSESRTLEYKETLPGGSDGDRREFLADVSSFANSAGGDLVYGVRERRDDGRATGIPEAIIGTTATNKDAEQLRLEQILRDGVEPRIPGVRYRWIDNSTPGSVLVIRVLRSWAGPHMVKFQQLSRFFARNATSKYQLDVFELRNAFLSSGATSDRARMFRSERLARILSGETPVPLEENTLLCVHVIPHVSLDGHNQIDFGPAQGATELMQPIYADGCQSTFNFDGIVSYSSIGRSSKALHYLQVFRNGVLETADCSMLGFESAKRKNVPSGAIASALFGFVDRAKRLLRRFEIEPPLSVFITLSGVRGATLGLSEQLRFYRGISTRQLDRDVLALPELLIQDSEVDVRVILRPALDALWQASCARHAIVITCSTPS